jgi:hypothetical protein
MILCFLPIAQTSISRLVRGPSIPTTYLLRTKSQRQFPAFIIIQREGETLLALLRDNMYKPSGQEQETIDEP